jgi:broad specificity phosphatase PhoE
VRYRRRVDLILVRHGLPDWAPNSLARNDPHLSDLGRLQAERVAKIAIEQWGPIDELLVSPMLRACETAEPIARALGLEPVVHQWMHEIANPPEWEGVPIDDIQTAWSDGNLRPLDELWEGMPGGESFRAFHRRVVEGLEETMKARGLRRESAEDPYLWQEEGPPRRMVLVAHGGTNAVVIGSLLGLDPTPWEWDRFESPHTGIARLSSLRIAHGHAFSLKAFGEVGHLDPEMVTR